jgi:hypothetical protein
VLHFGDFSPKKKKKEKREKDCRAGMEVGECKQRSKRGKKTKTLRRRKGFEKKRGILSLIVIFSASPELLRNLLNSDDLLWLPSAAYSPPLRPSPTPHRVHYPSLPLWCLTRDGIIGG